MKYRHDGKLKIKTPFHATKLDKENETMTTIVIKGWMEPSSPGVWLVSTEKKKDPEAKSYHSREERERDVKHVQTPVIYDVKNLPVVLSSSLNAQ